MALIPFGEYLPDQPALVNPGATVARNVLPRTGSDYEPLPDLTAVSPALTAYCRGAAAMSDVSGVAYDYAGDATKLYQVTAAAATDVSKVGGYTNGTDDRWEGVLWGNTCKMTNYANPVQTITLGGANFADLITSSLKPKARHISVDFNNFLILGNTNDATDGAVPNRVWWSAQNDPTDFQPSAATQCDNQDIVGEGGAVQKLLPSGERTIIFQQRAIQLMTYVGGAPIFSILPVEEKRGAVTPGGVTGLGRLAFYLSDDGFYGFDGNTSTPLGAGKVDRSFWAEVDSTYLGMISAAVDPRRKIVAWAYPTSNSTGSGVPDKILFHNWVSGRWAEGIVNVELLFRALSQGYTLEGLDAVSSSIDALPLSLDSPAWQGGVIQLGAFSTAHKLASFSGSNLAATIETGEFQLYPGERALVTEVWPMVDGGTLTMALGTRNRPNDSVTYTSAVSQNSIGACPFLSNARYHRARVSIAAASIWAHAQGIDNVISTPQGPF